MNTIQLHQDGRTASFHSLQQLCKTWVKQALVSILTAALMLSALVSFSAFAQDTVWVDDATPAGATLASDGTDLWTWVSSNPTPFSGTLAHQSALAAGEHQHYFFSTPPAGQLSIGVGDSLFAYVYLNPANPPTEIMLQWHDAANGWEHRAYWGANNIPWGTDGTVSRKYIGMVPLTPAGGVGAGGWVRLDVPASAVGLEGITLDGMAFTQFDGQATWDQAGKTAASTTNIPPTVSLTGPTNGATYTAPATIILSATAADSDGTIAKVEFYNGTTLLGAATPPTMTLSGVAAGSYTYTAKAYDNLGASTVSAPVSISVTNATGGSNIYYIYADHLNTPRVITDTANNVVWKWSSDPFGTDMAQEGVTASGAKFSYNLRFPGQYWDSETGLHQNYFRDYDPSTGRYPQSDPIGLAGGSFSTYSYVRSNPVGFIDPLGLEAVLPGPYGIPVPVLPITPPSNSGSGSAGAFPWNTPQSSQPFWPSWMQFAPTPGGGGESGEDYFQCLTKCDTAKTAGHNYCLWAYGPKGITPSDYNLVSCVAGITDTWQACRASCQKSCK